MGVDILIDGVLYPSNFPFSVSEESTPIDPADTTGATGQFTVSFDDNGNVTKRMINKAVTLSDNAQGVTTGTARGAGAQDGIASLSVDSRLTLLSVTRTALPYSGTLGGAFTYYLGLVGITSGFVIDTSITATPVVFPGWTGFVWDNLKAMCAALQVEISLVSNNIVLRPLRGRVAQVYRNSAQSWNLDETSLARSIEIYYYNSVLKANALAYPDGGWTPAIEIESALAAGVTQSFIYPISASLSAVQQPVCIDFVDQYYAASSVYTVSGADGLPVLASEWVAEGGSISVQIGQLDDDGVTVIPNTQSLIVTVTTSSNTQNAPYTIAMASSTTDDYSSLRIVGTGVFSNKQLATFLTGVDTTQVTTQVGVTVDNIFISSLEQAQHCALATLKTYGTAKHTITITTTGVNRLGDSGSYAFPTFADLDAAYVGMTFAGFDALWAGKTFQQFNDYWTSTVSASFANQAFGNVAGARLRYGDAMFRIRTATVTPTSITYIAEEDTTFADLDAIWAGATFAQFNAQWAGKTFADFAVAPLERTI